MYHERSGTEKAEVSILEADRPEQAHLETVFVETGLWAVTNDKKSLLGLEGSEDRH